MNEMKNRLIYYILKEFQNEHDDHGDFQQVSRKDVFNILLEKEIVTKDQEPLFHRTVTMMSTRSLFYDEEQKEGITLLKHINGSNHILTDYGHLVCLMWDKDFGTYGRIIIDDVDQKLTIDKPCKVFISCGERDNESEIAFFLKEKIEENKDCKAFFWNQQSPGSSLSRPLLENIIDEIDKSDFVFV